MNVCPQLTLALSLNGVVHIIKLFKRLYQRLKAFWMSSVTRRLLFVVSVHSEFRKYNGPVLAVNVSVLV